MKYAGLVLATVALASMGCGSSHSTTEEDAGGIRFDATPPPDTGPEPLDAGPSSDIGTSCTSSADCEGGYCITEDMGFAGGYCTMGCATDTDCGEGGACIQIDATTSFCFDRCDPAAATRDCRAGYGCASSLEIPSVCLPGCTDDTDCTEGLRCDPTGGFSASGRCYDPTAQLGDPCTDETMCGAEAICYAEDFAGWPGGSCVAFGCDPASGTGCAGDAVCIPAGRRGGICVDGCTSEMDCREAYDCEPSALGATYCAPACRTNDDCSGGLVCNPALGTCDVPFDASELGNVCARMFGACQGGTCVRETDAGFPGSYCTYIGCDTTMPDATDGCPGTGVCFSTAGGTTYCADACATDMDCRAGYACRANSAGGMGCVPACEVDMECTSMGYTCNQGTGLCTSALDPTAIGDACVRAADCPGGRCLTEASTGHPGGMCVATGCRLSGEGPAEACPTGTVCVDDATDPMDIGVCVPECTGTMSGECRDGYTCVSGACAPACTMATCTGGRTCNATTGRCE